MDIYSYIRDGQYKGERVAEHCKKVGQTWTPFEMALIIGKSERSIAEKHRVWRDLMNDYRDMPTFANRRHPVYESYQQKLNEYIEYQEKLTGMFEKPEPGTFYTCRINLVEKRTKVYGDSVSTTRRECIKLKSEFTSLEDVWDNAKSFCNSKLAEDKFMKIEDICIAKIYDPKNDVKIYADFDENTNCYDVSIREYTGNTTIFTFNRNIRYMFDREFYVYIPTPWGKMLALNEEERMLYYKILLILERWDPMGLADIGSITEYHVETYRALKSLIKAKEEKDIYNYLRGRYISSWSFGINDKKLEWFEQTCKKPISELMCCLNI